MATQINYNHPNFDLYKDQMVTPSPPRPPLEMTAMSETPSRYARGPDGTVILTWEEISDYLKTNKDIDVMNGEPPINMRSVDLHAPGAKDDSGKIRPRLIMEGFPDALLAIAQIATYGANKYSEGGWKQVPNGIPRYTDALYRHLLRAASGEIHDKESGLMHYAHAAWNALAVLQLVLQETSNPLSTR